MSHPEAFWGGAVHRVPDGDRIRVWRPHSDSVRGLAWVSDILLASAAEDSLVLVSEVETGQAVSRWSADSPVLAMAYLPLRKRLVVGTGRGQLVALELPRLTSVASFDMKSQVLALAADSASGRIAASAVGGRVVLLDGDLRQLTELPRPERDALSLRFSHDGRQLAAGAWFAVYYWDLAAGTIRRQETEHWGAVIDIDFTPDDRQLASIGRHTDSTLRLVDARSGIVQRRLQAHKLCGAALRVSPDGRWLASGSDDESLRLYDLQAPYRPR